MNTNTNNSHRQCGFTLIELMVAIVLSLVLLTGITYVVVNSNKSYNSTDSLARLQENARFAMQFLTQDIRRTGYMGCANDVSAVNTTLNDRSYGNATFAVLPLEGVDNIASGSTWSPSGTALGLSKTPIAGSDAIRTNYLDLTNPITIVQEMPNESASLFVNTGSGLKTGDIIALTDCSSADIMQITNTNGSGGPAGKDGMVHNAGTGDVPGNSTQKLSKSYGANSTILKFQSSSYYVAINGNGIGALYRQSPGGGVEELVEGVDSLQIVYGFANADRAPSLYKKASAITSANDWSKSVVSVRIALLLSTVASTPDGQYGRDVDTGTYDVNGTTVGPFNDRRQRRVFASTIALRNLKK